MVLVALEHNKLVEYIAQDEEQIKLLEMLAERRGMRVEDLAKGGIFAVPNRDELDYLLEAWELTFEEAFGKDREEVRLLNEGFIIPIYDSSYRVLFFINYNWERDKSRHYINVFPEGIRDLTVNVKMYGGHNLEQGIREGWMVVVEGLFDAKRLEAEGIPVVALLGSELLDYQKLFLRRFEQVLYIPDNDFTGAKGWRKVREGLDNVFKYEIDGTYKDTDEYALKGGIEYRQWIERLKMYRRVQT